MAACLVLLASHSAAALDQASLQLKWKHQFQFAGYYAALEQGFYRDAGLDVTIREGGPDIDVAETVASGKADFGVCSANVLREWTSGRRLVVLAAIFQHSPAVILVARRADISSVSDLRGRTLMDTPGSDEIAAMLRHEGVDYEALPRVAHEGNPRDLLAGRADAMVAYSTNEPFILEQLGAAYRTFSPSAYGIDFYGDNLCASEAEVKVRPDRVAAFRAASVKGWAYALAHKEATVDLILKRYSGKKSGEALLFEAEHMETLLGRDPGRIGEQDPARWQRIAATYRQLGFLNDDSLPGALIWDGNDGSMRRWLIPLLLVPAGLAIAALIAYRSRRSLPGALARLGALRWVAAMGRPRLSLIMSLLFIGLSIPVLIFILIYNYSKNSAAIVSILNDAVTQASHAGIERTENLIESTESPLRFIAELAAADLGYFRSEPSRDLLYRALTSAAHIDAAYVSFEDGYHRVVTRIDEDRRRSDPAIPKDANWHSSYIDAISYGLRRTRHRKFFDIWPHEVGNYDVATDTDMRILPGYQTAKTTRTLTVTEPSINPDTGFPILSLRVPIFHGVDFLGCASANITVDVLSRFLDKHRASAHSITLIADRNTGKIIAFPNKQKGVRIENGALKVATLADIDDANVREARRQHIIAGTDSFAFRSTADMFKLLRQSWSIRRPLQTPLGPRLPNRGESGRLSRDCGEHSLSVSLSQFDPSPMSSALFFRAWRHIDAAGATISSLVGVTEIAAMKVHAIRTGSVRIKSAQVEGRGHGLRRRLAIFTDQYWTEWLPTYVWVIEHREGIIVVDAGQGAHLLETGTSLHPYVGWEVTVSFESTVKKKSDRSCGRSVSGRAM